MERKKLLVTASTFPRWEGDTEPRFVLDLCRYMTDKYDVTVLVPASPGAKEREVLEGVKVIRYHYFPIHRWETLCYPGAIVPRIKEKKIRIFLVPFLFMGLYFKLLRILPEYDIVHAHWLIPQGIVQSFFKKPYIVTGHGGDVASFNNGIVKKLKMRCLQNAKTVVTVSQKCKAILEELNNKIDVKVIPMGCDTSKFGKENRIENYFNQYEKKVILFVGRLAEIKGVNYLIDAMQYIDALLVIVGDGPLRNELEEQSKKYGKRVIFLGGKNHHDLPKIFASADVFVIPSITDSKGAQEGMPTVIFEAMASGTPVIGTNTGGIKEIIQDGQNGLLCEEKSSDQLADCICRILNDEELLEELKTGAAETVKKYDYCNIARQYKAVLGKI